MSLGFHHLSLVCSNARRSLGFYKSVLGLRLVKTTVDFDNPDHYHLYLGDRQGTPGTLISLYEWQISPRGEAGVGGVRRVTLAVNDLAGWQERLTEKAVDYQEAYERDGQARLVLRDPDGLLIELVEGSDADASPRLYHLTCLCAEFPRLSDFYGNLLGLQPLPVLDQQGKTRQGWGADGKALLIFEQAAVEDASPARKGAGQVHHFALQVADEEALLVMRARLLAAGALASEIQNRVYYQSVLTRDPDGQLIELSTLGPGMLLDEGLEVLGEELMLPDWLEEYRQEIEANLSYFG